MSDSKILSLKRQLEKELQTVLPDATLEKVELPNTGGLSLYLIDSNYSLEALGSDTQQKVMNNPLYWMFCWASGHAMASLLHQDSAWVHGKTVLDFGSGSGVVAIASALAGAKQVVASDIDPMSQKAIELNSRLNGCESKINIVGDYRDAIEPGAIFELISVADVLYDAENRPLIDALLPLGDAMLLADSRVKDFTHPQLVEFKQAPGETFPYLGGFDEFSTVRFFQYR